MTKTNIKNMYDCINRIANNHKRNGVDRSNWFYNDDEFNNIKKNSNNIIL